MAITTYSELQTAVANWLSRDDLTSLIPDFIALAEAKFNRALRTRNMESSDSLTPADGVCTLPDDYLEMRRIYIDADQPYELEYLPPEQFWLKYPVLTTWAISPSRYYTIEGGSIYLSDTASGNDVKILYYAKIPALASNDTNWLLDSHPDIYLYAALAEAADKTKSNGDFQKYNAKTQGVVEQLTESDKHGKYSGSAMRVIAA